MIQQFLKRLNAPYPEPQDPKRLSINIFGIGLFIFLFLYLLRPFGLNYYQGSIFWVCLGFGFVTVFVSLFYEWLAFRLLNIRKDLPTWTLKKWIGSTLTLLLMIACANYFYINFVIGWAFLNWTNFFSMLYNTFLVGLFPIIFIGLNTQIRAAKANLANAQLIQAQLKNPPPETQPIQLTAQNQKEILEVNAQQIYFIEAMQNYVAIHYADDQTIKKQLLRNTISNINELLSQTTIIRCHRSYLVNTALIEKVEGNAQGLRLQLTQLPEVEIPVSRKYISDLRKKLDHK